MKALDPLDQFESSAACSAAIMALELAALLSPLAGDTSLHRDDDVVNSNIVTAIPMATTYLYCSLVVWLTIRGAETTVAIVCGRREGRRR